MKSKKMNRIISTILFLFPVFAYCQKLPVAELKKNGITQEEIRKTRSLNGKNGVAGYFLLLTQKNTSTIPNRINITHYFALYTAEKKILWLSEPVLYNSEVIFFEFVNNEIVLIENAPGPRNQLRISRFDLVTGKLNRVIDAEIPCQMGHDCDWIKYKEKSLAFFTNLNLHKGLKDSAIYEYNWQTDETKLISEVSSFAVDAVTGRNVSLSDVKYIKKKKAFEYGQ